MNIEFKTSFSRDLRRVRNQGIRRRVGEVIDNVEAAENLSEVANVRRLRASGTFYRIRLADYRIGLIVEGNVVTFVRILHRNEIYRYFP